MFKNVPIAVCFIVVDIVGLAILQGLQPTLSFGARQVISTSTDLNLATLPGFLLMGELASLSGMMELGFGSLNVLLGTVPGGLAMAAIIGAGAFSAVSGTSSACSAIMSRVALPELVKHKYDPALATGALSAGGTLGNLIPPGILLVFYASLAEVSLAKLFIACLLPGVILILMYMAQIYIQCRLNPTLAPVTGSRRRWKEKLHATRGLMPIVVVFGIIMGGIYGGVFSPNEAAATGTLFVFVYALIKKKVNLKSFTQALKGTFVTCGMSYGIMVGVNLFAPFCTLTNLPQTVAAWVLSFNLSALGLIIVMMVIYFILGIPMNATTMVLITMPIFLPILEAYHIDLLWFGVLLILQCELANLSPPVGMNLFVVASMSKPLGISLSTVFRGAWPFCGTMLVFNALLIAFPQIALWPVSLMK
jgi:tripartite ATP-independent transporter DctM subunit